MIILLPTQLVQIPKIAYKNVCNIEIEQAVEVWNSVGYYYYFSLFVCSLGVGSNWRNCTHALDNMLASKVLIFWSWLIKKISKKIESLETSIILVHFASLYACPFINDITVSFASWMTDQLITTAYLHMKY